MNNHLLDPYIATSQPSKVSKLWKGVGLQAKQKQIATVCNNVTQNNSVTFVENEATHYGRCFM